MQVFEYPVPSILWQEGVNLFQVHCGARLCQVEVYVDSLTASATLFPVWDEDIDFVSLQV